MACHNSAAKRAVYDALKSVDPTLPAPYAFWHPRGAKNSSDVDGREVVKALDSAWLAATLGNQTYDQLPPEEQLELLSHYLEARDELADATQRGASTVAALNRYVAVKTKEQERRDGETAKKWTKRAALTLAATALLSVGWMAGSTTPQVSEAAPNGITYTAAVKKQCVDGAEKVLLKKGKVVTWQWKSGRTAEKVMKKTRTACVVPAVSPALPSGGLTMNASGEVTALPSSFPKNPTVQDIAALGLTPESKVAPSLRIPQPNAPIAGAKLADTVKPVRAYPVEVPNVVGWSLAEGEIVNGTTTIVMVEWELRGGSGVVDLGNGTRVPFVNGVARVATSIGGADFTQGQMTGRITGNGIAPDYGQAQLPSSTTQNWTVKYAKDASGIGSPFGVNANSSVIASNQDGSVWINPDFTLAR